MQEEAANNSTNEDDIIDHVELFNNRTAEDDDVNNGPTIDNVNEHELTPEEQLLHDIFCGPSEAEASEDDGCLDCDYGYFEDEGPSDSSSL